MGDKDTLDITDTFVPYDDHTSKTKLLESLGGSLERQGTTNTMQVREAKATLDKITEGASVQHRYQPKTVRVSWTRRVLRWFSNNKPLSD